MGIDDDVGFDTLYAEVALASPVGTLEAGDPAVVPDVDVMTYPGSTGMLALGGGTLEVADGCLTLGGAGRTTHVLWPHGSASSSATAVRS